MSTTFMTGKPEQLLEFCNELKEEGVQVNSEYYTGEQGFLKISRVEPGIGLYCHNPLIKEDDKELKVHLPSHRKHFRKLAYKSMEDNNVEF